MALGHGECYPSKVSWRSEMAHVFIHVLICLCSLDSPPLSMDDKKHVFCWGSNWQCILVGRCISFGFECIYILQTLLFLCLCYVDCDRSDSGMVFECDCSILRSFRLWSPRVWQGFGPISVRFFARVWHHFGSIFARVWPHVGSILVSVWPHFGSILVMVWADFSSNIRLSTAPKIP